MYWWVTSQWHNLRNGTCRITQNGSCMAESLGSCPRSWTYRNETSCSNFKLMTQPTFGTRPCLVNGCESVPKNHTVFEHVLRDHVCHFPESIQNIYISPDDVITLLMDCNLLELGCIHQCFVDPQACIRTHYPPFLATWRASSSVGRCSGFIKRRSQSFLNMWSHICLGDSSDGECLILDSDISGRWRKCQGMLLATSTAIPDQFVECQWLLLSLAIGYS